MSVKRRRRSIMRDLNRNHRKFIGDASQARGDAHNALQPNDPAAAGPPAQASSTPAVRLLRGRNTYACADGGCAGRRLRRTVPHLQRLHHRLQPLRPYPPAPHTHHHPLATGPVGSVASPRRQPVIPASNRGGHHSQ